MKTRMGISFTKTLINQLSYDSRLVLAVSIAFCLSLPVLVADAFVPGSGEPIPEIEALVPAADQIGGFGHRLVNHRVRDFLSGYIRQRIEFGFPAPSTHAANGYRLQQSVDGENWVNYVRSDETLETANDAQESFTITPDGASYYRLMVIGGPKAGIPSNSEFVVPSNVNTQFAGWSLDESMWISGVMAPWLGRGLEAAFTVWRLDDDNTVVEDALTYQWYRVHPYTYEKTLIPDATEVTYFTTEEDLGGWHLMCEASGDGVLAGGSSRVVSVRDVLIPNPGFTTDVARDGFRLNLERALPALDPADLKIFYYDEAWNEVALPVIAVTPVDAMAVFDIEILTPPDVDEIHVHSTSKVWQIVTQMSQFHYMEGLTIELPLDEASFTLSYLAGEGGSLTGSTTQTVDAGQSGSEVNAVPDAGAVFDSWSDGVLTASRTDTDVQANLEVTATFRSEGGVEVDWYAEHGITLEAGQTWADLDSMDWLGKGMTLQEEFLAGTDPADPQSRFAATPPAAEGTGFSVHFQPSLPERRYTLFRTINLSDWVAVPGMQNMPGGNGPLVDAEPPEGAAFYRIEVSLP